MDQALRVICVLFLCCSSTNADPADLDFFTDFEDIDEPVGVAFSIGDMASEAVFSGNAFAGVAGIGQLYFSGTHAWMVNPEGTGMIDFTPNAGQVEFWARTRSNADGSTVITAFNDSDEIVDSVTLSAPDPFQLVSFNGNIDRIEVVNNATGTGLNAIDDFGFAPLIVEGDFDGNGMLNVEDIDLLTAEVRAGGANVSFDLTGDAQVNQQDRTRWVEILANSFFGDANLDGLFDSSDLVAVFQLNEYEDAIAGNSTWAEGDWNGDGDFDSGDLVAAFQSGAFERGPRAGMTTAVPEPSTSLLLGVASLLLGALRRSSRGGS